MIKLQKKDVQSYFFIFLILSLCITVKRNTTDLLETLDSRAERSSILLVVEKIQLSVDLIEEYIADGGKINIVNSYDCLKESIYLYNSIEEDSSEQFNRHNYYVYFVDSFLRGIRKNYSNNDKEYWKGFYNDLCIFNSYIQENHIENNVYKKPSILKLVNSAEIRKFTTIDLSDLPASD